MTRHHITFELALMLALTMLVTTAHAAPAARDTQPSTSAQASVGACIVSALTNVPPPPPSPSLPSWSPMPSLSLIGEDVTEADGRTHHYIIICVE